MTGITVFAARKSVAALAVFLIASAGAVAFASPALAGEVPSTLTFNAPAPGTGSVTVTPPISTDVAYGGSASYHVHLACATPFDASNSSIALTSSRQFVPVSPDPDASGSWVWDADANTYTYDGDALMTVTAGSTDIRVNVVGSSCFGGGFSRPLDTLSAIEGTQPASDAAWQHSTLTASYVNRKFFTPYAPQYVSGPVNDSYTYSLSPESTLPAGLTISSAGSFVGTPTAAGPFTALVIATDDRGHEWVKEVNGSILPSVSWAKPAVRTFANNLSYSDAFAGPDYNNYYTRYALVPGQGTLPIGLTLDPDGSISGTPNDTTGDYTYTVSATDAEDYTYTQQVTTALVDGPGPDSPWVTPTVPAAQWGHQFSARLEGPAGDTYTYAQTGGTLPGGFDLYDNGTIEGSSGDTPGLYTVEVTATDPDGNTWVQSVTVTLGERLPWTTLTIPHAQVGTPYTVRFVAPDYGSTYTYTYNFFGLGPVVVPSWLTMNPDGTFSGTPDAQTGMYLQVTAHDADGNVFSASFRFIVDPFVPVWSSTVIAPQYPGVPSTASVVASGDHVTYSVVSGSLPVGLTLNADGTITGSPLAIGPYDVIVQAEQDGETSEQEFTGSVLPPSVTLTLNFGIGSSDLTLDAAATGLAPGSDWSLQLHSTPATISSGIVAGNGSFSSTVRIPAGTPAGAHELILSGLSPSGAAVTAHAWFTLGRDGTILAISFTGPTPGLASLASTGAPDVDGAILVGLLGLIVGAGLLIFRRRRV